MNINKEPYWLTEEGIGIVEEKYGGATFMGAWAIKKKDGGWFDEPVDVFYQPNPDTSKGHSHYFGIFIRTGEAYITNAESAFSEPITGVVTKNGDVLVSRFRHDFQSKDGAMIDGGRDYIRKNAGDKTVSITVEGDKFIFNVYEGESNAS